MTFYIYGAIVAVILIPLGIWAKHSSEKDRYDERSK